MISSDLREAEELIDSRLDSPAALDESVTSWLNSFLDQFVHTTLMSDERDDAYANPFLELAILKELHKALERSIVRRVQSSGNDITSEEIIAYLDYEESNEDN